MEFIEVRENTSYNDVSTTVTFKCDPPMLFEPYSAGDGDSRISGSKGVFLRFSYVTICAFKPSDSRPYGRTVIHATETLQGGDGFCYGALADALVMDGHQSAWTALEAFGYSRAESDEAQQI